MINGEGKCLLEDIAGTKCTPLSGIHVGFHGSAGIGGRVGAAKVPKEYRNATLKNSPARQDQAAAYAVFDEYVRTFDRQFEEGYLGKEKTY